ncbi:hypothetical protein J0B03_10290 [Alkalibacter rhizosphaerae]|uniref:Uncharacterized protein n=1 Tax=Alkalibacter rhizosphaerae TaxID=2815577 RepID=A0A974XLI9_9FIRM|nr:hypothetical protein [Alkalibacter rhizosphaerae]QSX08176.1 hypothetical protein J0B03_10290 [Alkalibacter rhizosphaerae]
MMFPFLFIGLLQAENNPFTEAIASYKMNFSQYLGNAIGAMIVILLAFVVIGVVHKISQWLKKSRR